MTSVVNKVDEQQRRRADAVMQARASSRLEGLDLDAAAVALAERYVAGDLTSDELLDEMIRLPL